MSLYSIVFDDYPVRVAPRDPFFDPGHSEQAALHTLSKFLSQIPHQVHKDPSITVDKDHFQAKLDVQQFKPEELTVKVNDDNTVTIEGKHEEKPDEHGFISRHFVRKYILPEDCDVQKVQSSLSSDGVLSIFAPKKPDVKQVAYKQIPIIRTGPAVKNENKPAEKEG